MSRDTSKRRGRHRKGNTTGLTQSQQPQLLGIKRTMERYSSSSEFPQPKGSVVLPRKHRFLLLDAGTRGSTQHPLVPSPRVPRYPLKAKNFVLVALPKRGPTPTSSLDVVSTSHPPGSPRGRNTPQIFNRVRAAARAHLSLSSAAFSASSSFCRAVASRSWARSNSSSTSWIRRFKDATSASAWREQRSTQSGQVQPARGLIWGQRHRTGRQNKAGGLHRPKQSREAPPVRMLSSAALHAHACSAVTPQVSRPSA